MWKDPADRAATPYEVLALPFEPSREDVQKALVTFMKDRRNLPRLAVAREAMQRLQNGKARASVDLWMYDIDTPATPTDGTASALNLAPFRDVPVTPRGELYTDLDGADVSADFRPIETQPVRLSDITSFDGLEAIAFRPTFDV